MSNGQATIKGRFPIEGTLRYDGNLSRRFQGILHQFGPQAIFFLWAEHIGIVVHQILGLSRDVPLGGERDGERQEQDN
jgi:hypothetical protein